MGETDLQLLARYAGQHAEDAFAEIVRRHLDLVFSAALRQVRSPQLAEEVAQSTFTDLARQVHRLAPDTILTAWLYQVTRRTAIDVVRREARRQQREAAVADLDAMNANSAEPDWTHIEPFLDEAMDALDNADRTAVLLRYFENKPLREVGERLGTNEDAARKRVSRAVERLREFLARRGVGVGASGLAMMISANAVQAAPIGLSVSLASTAAAAFAGMTTTAALTTTTLATKTIAMTALQKTLIAAAIALTVGTPLVLQYQANKDLREANQTLQAQLIGLNDLQNENERLSNLLARTEEPRSDEQFRELLRLRSEVSQLRAARDLAQKAAATNTVRPARNAPTSPGPVSGDHFPRESWVFAGYANPESAMVSTAWAASAGDLATFFNSLTAGERTRLEAKAQRNGETEDQTRSRLSKEFGQTKSIRILKRETVSDNEIALMVLIETDDGRTEVPTMALERVGEEWKMAGPRRPRATTEH